MDTMNTTKQDIDQITSDMETDAKDTEPAAIHIPIQETPEQTDVSQAEDSLIASSVQKSKRKEKDKKAKKEKLSSADIRLNYYKLFWIFFIGCIIGVIVETIWCLLTRHHYENRVGVLYGPFNPVYGLGAVLLTICLKWLGNKRDLWIFLGSMVIGGAFEYACSLFQELAFGTVSWEYSQTQFNFNGRTNIMYSFFWGLLGVLWVKELLPRLSCWIDKIPKKPGFWLTCGLTVFMVINILITAMAVERQSQRRENIPAQNSVSRFLDKHYTDEYLEHKFPNMMVVEQLK